MGNVEFHSDKPRGEGVGSSQSSTYGLLPASHNLHLSALLTPQDIKEIVQKLSANLTASIRSLEHSLVSNDPHFLEHLKAIQQTASDIIHALNSKNSVHQDVIVLVTKSYAEQIAQYIARLDPKNDSEAYKHLPNMVNELPNIEKLSNELQDGASRLPLVKTTHTNPKN